MAGAALMLSVGLMPLDPDAGTVAVIGALIVAVAALLVSRRATLSVGARALTRILAVCILIEGFVFASLPILPNVGYQVAVFLLSLIGAHATLYESRWRPAEVGLALAGFFVVMCWMIASSTSPHIDVVLFQQDGSAALLRGASPYGLRFENIFGHGTPYYARELQVGNQLAFGFPYPPLSLLLAIPGYVIAGDYRYSAAAAVTISAGLVARAGRGRIATGAGMLIILAPITQVVLYWGWSEPFVAVVFAGTAYLAAKSSPSTTVALGLLVAAKQYCAPVLLVGYVLLHALRLKVGPWPMVIVPIAVAMATVVPFALWDFQGLVHSTVIVQLLQPFRLDAVAVPALLARFDLAPTSQTIGLVIAGVTALLLIRWAPRTVSGFCYATAIFFAVFFIFSKQAFLNYYFFVLVALACGIATTRVAPSADARDRSGAAGK
jgi:hypothetical protein